MKKIIVNKKMIKKITIKIIKKISQIIRNKLIISN
jgi:hypothetical protein